MDGSTFQQCTVLAIDLQPDQLACPAQGVTDTLLWPREDARLLCSASLIFICASLAMFGIPVGLDEVSRRIFTTETYNLSFGFSYDEPFEVGAVEVKISMGLSIGRCCHWQCNDC